jgi:uncharacterized tellurite resistance protein B-like protein
VSVVIEREVYLSARDTSLGFSVDAKRTLEPGGPGWTNVLTAITAVVKRLLTEHDHEAIAYVSPGPGLTEDDPRLMVYLCCVGTITDADVDDVNRFFSETDLPWRAEGVRNTPSDATPVVCAQVDVLWHVWHVRESHTVVCFYGLDADQELVLRCEPASETDPSVFPDVLRHALGIRTQIPQDNAPSLIEMMKVAWTLDMAERVIEADGYAHDTELDILQRTFSPRRLGALGLIDRASCVRLRTLARIELATLTTLHEKHSLLGLLFRIAQADGKVVATELAVLKLAADELDVPWENAQQYMLQQWG